MLACVAAACGAPQARPPMAFPGTIAAGASVKPGDVRRYTVDVATPGMYTLELRVAHDTGSDPEIHVKCDGADVTGAITVPYTGGLARRTTLRRPGVVLSAGRHELELDFSGGSGFFLDSLTAQPGTLPAPAPDPDPSAWQLAWSDEFEIAGPPDPAKWTAEISNDGGGNQELEYNTDRPENVRVEDGHLVIEARHEDYKDRHYTSARIKTKGKQEMLYGRIVVRAKLPAGAGTGPALWLRGDWSGQEWPASGEIDIMEHVGKNPGWIHGSAHSLGYYWIKGNQRTGVTWLPDVQHSFHDYALEWTPERLDYFVDNNRYLTVENDHAGVASWPFDHPEFLILNVAVGGSWGGPVDDSALPTRMEVDYVRVFRSARR